MALPSLSPSTIPAFAGTVPLPIATRQGGLFPHRHPGPDPGSMTTARPWIPDQVRDDDSLETTDYGRSIVVLSSYVFAASGSTI